MKRSPKVGSPSLMYARQKLVENVGSGVFSGVRGGLIIRFGGNGTGVKKSTAIMGRPGHVLLSIF